MFPVITGATGAERIYDGYPDVRARHDHERHVRQRRPVGRISASCARAPAARPHHVTPPRTPAFWPREPATRWRIRARESLVLEPAGMAAHSRFQLTAGQYSAESFNVEFSRSRPGRSRGSLARDWSRECPHLPWPNGPAVLCLVPAADDGGSGSLTNPDPDAAPTATGDNDQLRLINARAARRRGDRARPRVRTPRMRGAVRRQGASPLTSSRATFPASRRQNVRRRRLLRPPVQRRARWRRPLRHRRRFVGGRHRRIEDHDRDLASRGDIREWRAPGRDIQRNVSYCSSANQTGDAHGVPSASAVARVMYELASTIAATALRCPPGPLYSIAT